MPLMRSGSKNAVKSNIEEMIKSGHSQAQSAAAALDTARKAGKKIPKKRGKNDNK